jgi:hypothetical protein
MEAELEGGNGLLGLGCAALQHERGLLTGEQRFLNGGQLGITGFVLGFQVGDLLLFEYLDRANRDREHAGISQRFQTRRLSFYFGGGDHLRIQRFDLLSDETQERLSPSFSEVN